MNNEKLLLEFKDSYQAAKELGQSLIARRKFNLDLYTGYDPKFNVENIDNISAHVPYVKTLFDNVFPLLTAKLPISKVTARNTSKNYTAAKLMDRLINYTFDVNQFEKKYMMIKKESMLAGDAFAMVIWSPEPEKNYPLIIHINADNVYPHPSKLDIDDEWPMFIGREMTKRQMIDMGWNKEAIKKLSSSKLGDQSYRKKQLAKLGLSNATEESSSENKKDDLYEVAIRWGMMSLVKSDEAPQKMGMVVVANDEAIINTDPLSDKLQTFESPYLNNVMPLAHLGYDPIPHTFFCQSFIDPVAKDQVELNDLENMKRSNYYRRNNPPLAVDLDAQADLSTLKFLTAIPWVLKGGAKSVQMMLLPDLAPAIGNDQRMIMSRMQNVTGASDYLNPSPETIQKGSGKSATHAAIMNENTKMRFRPQAVYEDRFMEKIGKLLINMWQDKKFFNEEVALGIEDDEGSSEIALIKNGMVQGDLDFVTTSASSVAQSDSAVMTTAVQIKELFAQDPGKDMTEVDRVILDKAGFDPNKIMKPKVGMLPELVARLKQWMFVKNQPEFEHMPTGEKTKILNRIDILTTQIKELQSKIQQDQPQQQPGQPGQPQQPGAPAPGGQGQPQTPGGPGQQGQASIQPKVGA